MKALLLFSLLIALVCTQTVSPPPSQASKIKTFRNHKRFAIKYDKFKDETHVSVGPFFIGGTKAYIVSGFTLGMSAHFFYKGQIVNKPIKDFYILFRSRSKNWTFLRSRDLYAIVDGERMALGEGDRDSDLRFGMVSESLINALTSETFTKIATGSKVEIKVGDVEMALNDEHLQAFRDLIVLSAPLNPD